MTIPVVDIFAGPGGLGEGFSSYVPNGRKEPAFKISVSAEMEANAARTLRLRAFFRQFPPGEVPESYYEYVRGKRDTPWTEATRGEWKAACEEALQLTLGIAEHDRILADRVAKVAGQDQPWVLVGGPPCQAYSLVGRSRNKGNRDYLPEKDERHFLYRHYLELIRKFSPAVFVMENVKGILSSKVGGSLIFPQILRDLSQPGGHGGPRYRILPLVTPDPGTEDDSSRFILRAEELGVPQARHRVILLGISEQLSDGYTPITAQPTQTYVEHVLRHLPRRRSGITKQKVQDWRRDAERILVATAKLVQRTQKDVADELFAAAHRLPATDPGSGGRWMRWAGDYGHLPDHLKDWLHDPRLGGILNHEVRAHMAEDLKRYAYTAAFTKVHKQSPKGPDEFPTALYPDHLSWGSGGFSDRFKAQAWKRPSSTVTSHLSKDGHYFIHPDASQLRSISVREAARLQTFPDNYFFEGSRGAQFRQVGNAVPPWMARQIAEVVYSALTSR
ncbi:DNA cytosine methyltransferase [Pseudoxanthomonas suwonensis]|uniref:DNA cytosine methyltransferase n=1 Tax=Pseudoxanthomonas suwonensis TaxID=314722 RepID=UPI00048EC203|nr:DNA cytosine methyltransferase [Pseudoxanthomonas suwonensis]